MLKLKAIFSKAVNVSNKLKSWKIKPSSSLLNLFKLLPFNLVISLPLIIILPDVTLSIVETTFNKVFSNVKYILDKKYEKIYVSPVFDYKTHFLNCHEFFKKKLIKVISLSEVDTKNTNCI